MAQISGNSGSFSVVLPTLGALAFLAALIAVLTGLALAFPGPRWTPMWNLNPQAYEAFSRLGRPAEILLFGLAGLCIVTGAGLIQRKRWAWRLALLGMGANGAGDLVSLVLTRQFFRFGAGVLIAAGFIFFLTLTPVRRT
ncbi:MAG: hypothetical protein ACRD5L_02615, partial [Bryobacteraceae bacterium]